MVNYNSYNYNPYIQDLQSMRDRIDRTVQQYQQQNQNIPQQPTNLTQNFQLAPMQQQNDLQAKYVNNVDEVKNTFVMREGLFLNKEKNTLWIKDINGNIKSYSLTEIIESDPKDIEINNLKKEIESMKAMMNQQIEIPKMDNKPEKKSK